MTFSANVLALDTKNEVERIVTALKKQVGQVLKRRGAVIAISGGIDSSVVAGLCARAFGPTRCHALLMPERDSSESTLALSRSVADAFGIPHTLEEISATLDAIGCYQRRDEAVRQVVPDYGPGFKFKIVLPGAKAGADYNVYSIVVERPDGAIERHRLPLEPYLQIVAATNFKQRIRKTLEYYWADKLHYVCTGTPNRLEYDQGFFVKNGDGAADVKPIAHLYKTQVYALAKELGVPEAVRARPPTTDTYSLAQGQDEFYFALPYPQMDLCLYGKNNGVAPADVAAAADLTTEQVEWVYGDIDKKRATTRYLHERPLLVDKPLELDR
ncbi:MAG: NAD(+) synthase [Labilithrix sp.]|nr:NAD(+) synthase [Labilithrix sp.]